MTQSRAAEGLCTRLGSLNCYSERGAFTVRGRRVLQILSDVVRDLPNYNFWHRPAEIQRPRMLPEQILMSPARETVSIEFR